MGDTTPIDTATCRAAIANLAGRVAARPPMRPTSENALILKEPACGHGCGTCYMACAIAPARLAWWRGELAKAELHEASGAFDHNGIRYDYPAGRA